MSFRCFLQSRNASIRAWASASLPTATVANPDTETVTDTGSATVTATARSHYHYVVSGFDGSSAISERDVAQLLFPRMGPGYALPAAA